MNHWEDYQQSAGGPGVGESGEPYTVHDACITITASNAPAVLTLTDGRVVTAVIQTPEEAEELAANRLARLPSDLLADQAKPVAHTIADALVAAGYGSP